MVRLLDLYEKEIVGKMKEQFGYRNNYEVPKIDKIVLNMGLGKASENKRYLEEGVKLLSAITGQHPVITEARRAVAGFKVRVGDKVGCKVTLRKKKMYEFLDRLVSIVIPRFKDFQGLSLKSFDKQGNYSLGVAEQSAFTEINHDEIEFKLGMDICLTISNGSPNESLELLKFFGMPFKKAAGDK